MTLRELVSCASPLDSPRTVRDHLNATKCEDIGQTTVINLTVNSTDVKIKEVSSIKINDNAKKCNEEQEPIKCDYQKLIDKIKILEHKQSIIWNNVFMAAQIEIVKGGDDKKKILLKGRVDKLEDNFNKLYFGDDVVGFYFIDNTK